MAGFQVTAEGNAYRVYGHAAEQPDKSLALCIAPASKLPAAFQGPRESDREATRALELAGSNPHWGVASD